MFYSENELCLTIGVSTVLFSGDLQLFCDRDPKYSKSVII